MRRSIIAASAAAIASFAGYGSALAQGVEVYVGPAKPKVSLRFRATTREG